MSSGIKKRVLVTGSGGFLGSHLMRIAEKSYPNNLYLPVKSADYDLRYRSEVVRVLNDKKPDSIIHLAAKVGGIGANMANPGMFFYDNMAMGLHLVEESRQYGIEKFTCVGTCCCYPKLCKVPFQEEDLWKGYPEETNAPYGIAKKAILVQMQAYRQEYGFNGIFLIPTNLYGPGERLHELNNSHVILAIIRKIADAIETKQEQVELWGDGSVTREFLYVEDAARGILLAHENYNKADPINLGSSNEVTIKDLAMMIRSIMGYKGEFFWNTNYPNGQPRRRVDSSYAKEEFGFKPRVDFIAGLEKTVRWFFTNADKKQ